jgi:hypothetical protein
MNYKVLWIDDECNTSYGRDFIGQAEQDNVDIIAYESHEEGFIYLENNKINIHAVILDAKVKNKKDDTVTGLEGLRASRDRLIEINKNNYLPYFIFTGQPDYQTNTIFKESFGDFYIKGVDNVRLIADLIEKVENKEEYILQKKFKDVFDACNDKYLGVKAKTYLLQIIKKMQSDDSEDVVKSFNAIRDVIELFFYKLNSIQVIPNIVFEDKKGWITGCSKFLSSKHDKLEWIENPIHPAVSFQIFTILQIVQDASHEVPEKLNLRIKDFITTNRTSYLYKSTVYLLIDMIVWFKKFIDEHSDIEQNKLLWKEIEITGASKNNVSLLDSDKICGFIEQDDKGNFHCNEYLLNYGFTQSNFKLGDNIEIIEFQDNGNSRTSFYYPKFATKYKKI